MDHGSNINTTGHHLRDLIESQKLEIVCSGNLFSNNLPVLSACINPSWILHTRTLLRDNNLSLEERTANLQPQRQNDSLFMEDFIADGIEGEPLSKINRCYLALQVTCRSNISTGNGKAIWFNAMKDKKNWKLDRYICPPQPSPHIKAWENWQASLKSTYNLSRTLALSSSLELGTWHAETHPTG